MNNENEIIKIIDDSIFCKKPKIVTDKFEEITNHSANYKSPLNQTSSLNDFISMKKFFKSKEK
jgi:hypothetical protein